MKKSILALTLTALVAGTMAQAQVVLFDNGSVVTNPGQGAGGGDASAVQAGFNTFGFGAGFGGSYGWGDDFSTPCGVLWSPSQLEVYAYQTNATAPTITEAYVTIYDGPPGAPSSNVIFGDFTTNRLISAVFRPGTAAGSFTYRTTQTTLTNTQRAIQAVRINLSGCPVIGDGAASKQYWIGVSLLGNASFGGPSTPPIAPARPTDNAVGVGNPAATLRAWPAIIDSTANLTNDFPFVLRGTAFVVGCPGPVILGQPASRSGCPNGAASFTVDVATHLPPTFQWRKNRFPIAFSANASAMTSTLLVASIGPADEGSYDCIVSSLGGSTTSTPATLTIYQPIQPLSISPTQSLCINTAAILSATIPNLASVGQVTYSWTHDGQPLPETSATLTLPAVRPADSGTFICTVTGPCNVVTSAPIHVTVLPVLAISQQPQSLSICRPLGASFSVTAAGNGPLAYQWRKAGSPIDARANPTAASDTLQFAHVHATDNGSYDCIVTDPCTSVTSAPATLTTRYCVCLLADIAGGGPDGLEGDGIIDGSDFIAFINAFAVGDVNIDPRADIAGGGLVGLDPDGIIDGTDFIIFINVFAAGC